MHPTPKALTHIEQADELRGLLVGCLVAVNDMRNGYPERELANSPAELFTRARELGIDLSDIENPPDKEN